MPGIRCIIAGRGSYLPELQTQIDVEGVNDLVDLAGFVPDDELRATLQRAGCVVIPSLYEPFGIVALEGMAAGAPTIVARTGGLAEIVEGTGRRPAVRARQPPRPGRAQIEEVLIDSAARARRCARRRLRCSRLATRGTRSPRRPLDVYEAACTGALAVTAHGLVSRAHVDAPSDSPTA